MSDVEVVAAGPADPATELGRVLISRGWHLAVAESLTGGMLTAAIAQGEDAREWCRGGIVAYQRSVKQEILGVSDVPLVSERCVREMAIGVSELLHADVGVAVTGVGGPAPDEGQDPGTVWMAVRLPDRDVRTELRHFSGRAPAEVCDASCQRVIDLVLRVLREEARPA